MNSIHSGKAGSRSERGAILMLGTMAIPVIMAILGISVDLSVMYSIKGRLQMALDGAAIAALRSLSLSQSVSGQRDAATLVAQEWFDANFSGNYMGASTVSSPTITVTQSTQTYVTTVDISATTTSPSYFMKYFGAGATTITGSSEASRRNVVITLVLDRSNSMNDTNNSYNGLTPCQQMVKAAKQFTGMFQPGRDYIGLVTFAESVNIALDPTTSFQTALGYTNAAGSASGALDNITCTGGTNTPSAISVAWNENYRTALPGAFNVIVLMTDGVPTAGTFKMVTTAATDPSGSAQSAILTTSTCTDSTGKAIKNGGNMVSHPANWADNSGQSSGSISLGTGSYSGWSPITGPIGALYSDSSGGFYGVGPWFSPSTSYIENTNLSGTGCGFDGGLKSPTSDVSFVPPYDIFGNSVMGYQSVSTSTILGYRRASLTNSNLVNVIQNLTDNAANFARTSNTLANSSSFPGTTIYTIGLGGNGGVNFNLLQRIANDPSESPDGGATYPAYTGYNTNQPIGQFVYSADSSELGSAFATIASQIIRLSK